MGAGGTPDIIKPPTKPLPTYSTNVKLADGTVEEVWVDGTKGPLIYQPQTVDGRTIWAERWIEVVGASDRKHSVPLQPWKEMGLREQKIYIDVVGASDRKHSVPLQPWKEMGLTEQKIYIDVVARRNRKLRDLHQAALEREQETAQLEDSAPEPEEAAPKAPVVTYFGGYGGAAAMWGDALKALYG
eukprot:CAMPEP_0175465406 /NCGR_PEP_ID=MMETSP0095-20121207/70278_1 /TAXON_ID=311494 /ORGANISM="Alexandrium monilatum, Strain CCMP3105" /LENGTH=185 /DNA_ID=CAMNT_0016766727 /DNA_START=27 /DNA_END=581 /DNA_ORIENTATION=-